MTREPLEARGGEAAVRQHKGSWGSAKDIMPLCLCALVNSSFRLPAFFRSP